MELEFYGWGHYDHEASRKAEKAGVPYTAQKMLEEIVRYDNPLWKKAEKMVVEEIRRKKYWFAGDCHQDTPLGMPIFRVDGELVYFWVTWRHWGALMAEAHSDETHHYDYIDFYMDCSSEDEHFRLPVVGRDVDETGKTLDE